MGKRAWPVLAIAAAAVLAGCSPGAAEGAASGAAPSVALVELQEGAPPCLEEERADFLILDENRSLLKEMTISEETPYWGVRVENTGDHPIYVAIGEESVAVSPQDQAWIYSDSYFEAGTYEIGFACTAGGNMSGLAEFWCADSVEAVTIE